MKTARTISPRSVERRAYDMEGKSSSGIRSKAARRWAFYDWANSTYSLVVSSTFFPIFFGLVTSTGEVNLWGRSWENTSFYSYCLSFTFLLTVICMPWVTALADKYSVRRQLLLTCCLGGAFACMFLGFLEAHSPLLGMLPFIVSGFFFSMSLVLYNAWLPELGNLQEQHALSARGFSLGYVGSVLLMFLLIPILAGWLGNDSWSEVTRYKVCFALTGVWWAGFGLYSIMGLPNQPRQKEASAPTWGLLRNTIAQALKAPLTRGFLPVFFLISMGVQTIMYLATFFGSKLMQIPPMHLILTIIALQLIAVPGAITTARMAQKWGPQRMWAWLTLAWALLCLGAWFMRTPLHFYGLALGVGWMMGGIQSLMRSVYSNLVTQKTNHSVWFGLYDLMEKSGIWLGGLLFGIIEQSTGDMRQTLWFLMACFALGTIGILKWSARFKTELLPIFKGRIV